MCLGRGLGQDVSIVKLGCCFFLCLNAKTEKWSDRGSGWVRKLAISQSERMPLRACALFAPLATHANLSVNLHLHKETTLLTTSFYLFLFFQSNSLFVFGCIPLFNVFSILLAQLNWHHILSIDQ